MARDSDTAAAGGKAERRGRGFTRAGDAKEVPVALAERAAAAGLSAPEPLRVPPVHGTLRLAEA